MNIREYEAADCQSIIKLFYETVHSVNAGDYTKEQLNAWAPDSVDAVSWHQSLSEHYSIVAEQDGIIVGFGDLDGAYLDRLYVHKDYQATGIATAITDLLEAYALKNRQPKVTTHASITAKLFFEKRGYQVIAKQQVQRDKVLLTNFVMEKTLPNAYYYEP